MSVNVAQKLIESHLHQNVLTHVIRGSFAL